MSEPGPSVTFWFMVSVVATRARVGGVFGLLASQGKFNWHLGFIVLLSAYAHYGLLLYFFFIQRHAPQKCLGSHGKLMVDVIAMFSAMA